MTFNGALEVKTKIEQGRKLTRDKGGKLHLWRRLVTSILSEKLRRHRRAISGGPRGTGGDEGRLKS